MKNNLTYIVFSIRPNPASTTINILCKLESGQKARINIYESWGNLVLEDNLHERETEINIEKLIPGIYTCIVQGTGINEITKIVIIR